MFEFVDDKLGRVKVINITEARASMATIMGDKEFNYIITKNNRPIRVIINYSTYKQNQAAGTFSKPLKNAEPKNNLKGLIESKEKDLQIFRNKNFIPQKTEYDLIPPESEVPEENVEPVNEPIVQTSSSDYILDEPVAVDIPHPDSVETSAPDPEITPEDLGLYTPPPSSDYLNRFKKLYETPRYDSLFQSTQKKRPIKEDSISSIESHQNQPRQQVQSAAGQKQSPQKESYQNQSHQPVPAPLTETRRRQDDLPSIQELLMDLENEPLSGEDEALSPDQVNHLLNRISK